MIYMHDLQVNNFAGNLPKYTPVLHNHSIELKVLVAT